jgi:hypothetical protein
MNTVDAKDRAKTSREEMEARGETFYPGPSRSHLAAYPPKERWDNWTELDSQTWPRRKERHYSLVTTTWFNCESACGPLTPGKTRFEPIRRDSTTNTREFIVTLLCQQHLTL